MQQLTAESAGAVVVCCGFTGDRDAGSSAAPATIGETVGTPCHAAAGALGDRARRDAALSSEQVSIPARAPAGRAARAAGMGGHGNSSGGRM